MFKGCFEPLPLLFMAPRPLATIVVTSQANLRRDTMIRDEDADFMYKKSALCCLQAWSQSKTE